MIWPFFFLEVKNALNAMELKDKKYEIMNDP
jgi:hypothetical protein